MNLTHKIHQVMQGLSPFHFFIVGVSGGADSVCLALVLKELGVDFVIAHLNHSLRGRESDEDAVFVKRFAKSLGVPCEIKKIRISKKGNLESNARAARYAFLEEVRQKYGAPAIAVAHHQDDQIETILMNLHRGAGLRGLRGMQPVSDRIVRPLLGVSKKEILKYLKKRKQPYREDRTNYDTSYLRNRIRHVAIPLLRASDPGFLEKLLRYSAQADCELKRLDAAAEEWIKDNYKNNIFSRTAFKRLPENLKTEVAIRLCGAHDLYRASVQRLLEFIECAPTGKQLKIKNVNFSIDYDAVGVIGTDGYAKTPFVGTRHGSTMLTTGALSLQIGETKWGSWRIKLSPEGEDIYPRLQASVRSWRPGDRFQPAGMSGHKKLQDFFTDSKIPREERSLIPLIIGENGDILSVGNLRWSEKAKRAGLDKILTITHA